MEHEVFIGANYFNKKKIYNSKYKILSVNFPHESIESSNHTAVKGDEFYKAKMGERWLVVNAISIRT